MALAGVFAERFRVEKTVATGGMGRVYRAMDLTTQRPVALKELMLDNPEYLERFQREAELLATLSHPGIVRYVAHGQHQGQWYLAMDWVEGDPLSAVMRAEGLTHDETLDLARQLAAALGHLHQRGLVHRDVKPANVMITRTPQLHVTLVDFGLARPGTTLAGLTRTGIAIGSPGFMSPEQAFGRKSLGAQSDIFALGCVLYACLVGDVPFPGNEWLAVQASILSLTPTSPAERGAPGNGGLSALVMKMLARSERARPADGIAVFEALANIPNDGSTRRVRRALQPTPSPVDQPTAAMPRPSMRFVIAISPREEDEGKEEVEVPSEELQVLQRLAREHHGHLAVMSDGTCTLVASSDDPLERVQAAGRCALALFQALPSRCVALAMGGDEAGVLDRGVQLLTAEYARSLIHERIGVRIDPSTDEQLAVVFRTEVKGSARYLVTEASPTD